MTTYALGAEAMRRSLVSLADRRIAEAAAQLRRPGISERQSYRLRSAVRTLREIKREMRNVKVETRA